MVVLPDVLAPDLDVVFCGTAASRRSAALCAYYAGPGNRFWSALHAVGLTPHRLDPAAFREVLAFGIGLTDLSKTASGSDRDIGTGSFDITGLREKMTRFQPRILAFTSKNAAKAYLSQRHVEYGLLATRFGRTALFVLTSPSGAARGSWDIGPWQALAELVRSSP